MIHTIKNKNLQYLIGGDEILSAPIEPYDELVCDFLNDLSQELRSSNEAAQYPDIMSFAFWCRRANINKLKDEYEDGKVRLGLGMVFHITPTNVPVNFAFSFAFGLVSGNANVVKVPLKPFKQIELICFAIGKLFLKAKYQKLKEMTAFVNYNNIDDITSVFSSVCNARIIWGGDSTIRNIRKMSIPVRGIEIAFSDRYSFCVIGLNSVRELNDIELNRLAENFYNDTYIMDQNACSSPHLIVWTGPRDEKVQDRFWSAVHRVARGRYQLANINAVDKYTLFCRDAIELTEFQEFKRYGNHVYRIIMGDFPQKVDSLRGKYGYFYEFNISDINKLAHIVNTKYQTLTYFGIDKTLLVDFVVINRLMGIDRIVPIGRALDINVIWDGYDIVKTLSRVVYVR